jgi:flagellar basal-body rod protein FlgF
VSDIAAQVSLKISQLAQEFEVVTNNMANVSTVGYKRRINDFSKVMADKLNPPTEKDKDKQQETPVVYDFTQGTLDQTGGKLDFAICGSGFFTIETPDGPLYTRNGLFHLDKDSKLVDSQGRFVAGEAGPITIPPTVGIMDVSVARDGTVSAGVAPIGKLKLADFGDDQNKLAAVGANCFKMTDSKVKPATPKDTIIQQGALEGSNVQLVEELVDMIMVSRLYESNMKFLNVQKDSSQSLMNVAMA